MKNITFYGSDASNEISLLEYGLLVSNEAHKDGSCSHFCVYKHGENFDSGHIYPKDLINLINGDDWMKKEDVKSFLSFTGETIEEFINSDLVNQLQSLIQYWGIENIFGISYTCMTEEEVKERYL